jgi:hypothetical protein
MTGTTLTGVVTTASQAKRFFSDRVVHQASIENVPLSKAERKMLFWSESDPEWEGSDALDATTALSAEMSDDQYEAKITGLLKRAYEAECAADGQAKGRWQAAAAVLNSGDYYISIMVNDAIGSKLRLWPHVWGVRAVPAALGVIAICGLARFGAWRVIKSYLGHDPSQDEFGFALWSAALAGGVAVGMWHMLKKRWEQR